METLVRIYFVIAMSVYFMVALMFTLVWFITSHKMKLDFEWSLLETWGRNREYFITGWRNNPPSFLGILRRHYKWVTYEVISTSVFVITLGLDYGLVYAGLICIIVNFVRTRLKNAYKRLSLVHYVFKGSIKYL